MLWFESFVKQPVQRSDVEHGPHQSFPWPEQTFASGCLHISPCFGKHLQSLWTCRHNTSRVRGLFWCWERNWLNKLLHHEMVALKLKSISRFSVILLINKQTNRNKKHNFTGGANKVFTWSQMFYIFAALLSSWNLKAHLSSDSFFWFENLVFQPFTSTLWFII